MNIQRFKTIVPVVALLLAGCTYNGPTAVYDQAQPAYVSPTISGLTPGSAPAGINYITIAGTNFSPVLNDNKVYVNGVTAEIVSGTATSLTIRRPNTSGAASTVKIVTYGEYEVASFSPYKLDKVSEPYGNYAAGLALGGMVVDKATENVYFVERTGSVYKVTSDGQNIAIGSSPVQATDCKLATDGRILILYDNRTIKVMDPVSGAVTDWAKAPSGKKMKTADFDAQGNFYGGGTQSGIYQILPDLKTPAAALATPTTKDIYARDTILCIKILNNYLYALVKPTVAAGGTSVASLWRHSLADMATTKKLGEKELVCDLSTGSILATATVRSFELSTDGVLYFGTTLANPIISHVLATGAEDIVYKGLIPSSAEALGWGNGHYLYMMLGGTTGNLYRIDIGAAGYPH